MLSKTPRISRSKTSSLQKCQSQQPRPSRTRPGLFPRLRRFCHLASLLKWWFFENLDFPQTDLSVGVLAVPIKGPCLVQRAVHAVAEARGEVELLQPTVCGCGYGYGTACVTACGLRVEHDTDMAYGWRSERCDASVPQRRSIDVCVGENRSRWL